MEGMKSSKNRNSVTVKHTSPHFPISNSFKKQLTQK